MGPEGKGGKDMLRELGGLRDKGVIVEQGGAGVGPEVWGKVRVGPEWGG